MRFTVLSAGVARAVVGLRHPLAHLRGAGVAAMRRAGVAVQVLGEAPVLGSPERCAEALDACLRVNEVQFMPALALAQSLPSYIFRVVPTRPALIPSRPLSPVAASNRHGFPSHFQC